MLRALVCFLLALGLSTTLQVAWLRPALLPEGLRPPGLRFEAVYAAWDQQHKAKQHTDALATVDEYLLAGDDLSEYGQDARSMRLLSARSGGAGPARAEERPLEWRLERFAARRTSREWGALAGALLFGVLGVTRLPGRRRGAREVEVLGPRPSMEQLTHVDAPPSRAPRPLAWLGLICVAAAASGAWAGLHYLGVALVHPPVLAAVGLAALVRGVIEPLLTPRQ
jgi:hypothetical protein